MMTTIANVERAEDLLEQTREAIDELDRTIVQLLSERAEKVVQIGSLKNNLDLLVRSRETEETVLRNVVAANPGPLTDGEVLSIYRRILRSMRTLQEVELDVLAARAKAAPGIARDQAGQSCDQYREGAD